MLLNVALLLIDPFARCIVLFYFSSFRSAQSAAVKAWLWSLEDNPECNYPYAEIATSLARVKVHASRHSLEY